VAEESEPTTESEPVAEPEPEPEPEETKEPESSTEPELEAEPAQEEPEPESEPAPESELKQGNETAFVTTIETFRTSEDYPWMDEDSLTYAEGDELLVLMGYEVCERIEALDQPITMESFEADADAYAEEQGIWGPEAVSLYLAAEHLCPNAHEALPES